MFMVPAATMTLSAPNASLTPRLLPSGLLRRFDDVDEDRIGDPDPRPLKHHTSLTQHDRRHCAAELTMWV